MKVIKQAELEMHSEDSIQCPLATISEQFDKFNKLDYNFIIYMANLFLSLFDQGKNI